MSRTTVWPASQVAGRWQRRGRYVPESLTHPAKMIPEIAAEAIRRFTSPGDLVLDPMCGIGTTLVEAVHLGRDAVGVEYEPSWANHARANLALARREGASGRGVVITGNALDLLSPTTRLCRPVALVLTSPPYGSSLHDRVLEHRGKPFRKARVRYSADRTNLAYVGDDALLTSLREVLAGCRALLQPAGHVVLTARPWRRDARLIDFPGALEVAARAAGLDVVDRHVALLAALREGGLVSHASFFQRDRARYRRDMGIPVQIVAHEDVLILARA